MPGTNPQQATLIADTLIKEALRDYALVPNKVLIDQQTLLAAHLAKERNQPSVFASGNHMDYVGSYAIANMSGNSAIYWRGAGAGTVRVFNLKDADLVRLKMWAVLPPTNPPLIIGYALSVNDYLNPVPLDQFSFIGTNQTLALSATLFNFQFLGEEIPCSGNKFIHILGGNSIADMWAFLGVPPQSGSPNKYDALTYALIK